MSGAGSSEAVGSKPLEWITLAPQDVAEEVPRNTHKEMLGLLERAGENGAFLQEFRVFEGWEGDLTHEKLEKAMHLLRKLTNRTLQFQRSPLNGKPFRWRFKPADTDRT